MKRKKGEGMVETNLICIHLSVASISNRFPLLCHTRNLCARTVRAEFLDEVLSL